MERSLSMTARSATIRLAILLLILVPLAYGQEPQKSAAQKAQPAGVLELAREAAKDGRLAWKLTVPEEVEALLGPPEKRETRNDGGMSVLTFEYADLAMYFGKFRDKAGPYTLRGIVAVTTKTQPDGTVEHEPTEELDIGADRLLVLRNEKDLSKLDDFWGFAGVSLEKCDLRDRGGEHKYSDLLKTMPFDTRTIWPPAERMPEGFNPARLLEEGKNPGLGVRGLHARGVDGHGVRIAIIDQPQKADHEEYKEQIERYEVIGCEDADPQMHGPPVASIAVGKTCGVAPRARLSYYAVASWQMDNTPFSDVIEKILKENEGRSTNERIRVVSISTGMFPKQKHYDRWQDVTRRAAESGLMIVTCSQYAFKYGTLLRTPGADADNPKSYEAGLYGVRPEALLIPTGGRTTASHYGTDVYTYWTQGGMSWATPYLAGTAALAFQVKPDITPERIIALWQQTATQTDAGLVINPVKFIEAVKRE